MSPIIQSIYAPHQGWTTNREIDDDLMLGVAETGRKLITWQLLKPIA
jgi:hypothetical protein